MVRLRSPQAFSKSKPEKVAHAFSIQRVKGLPPAAASQMRSGSIQKSKLKPTVGVMGKPGLVNRVGGAGGGLNTKANRRGLL